MDSEDSDEKEGAEGGGGLRLGSLPGGEGEGTDRRRSVSSDGED